MTTLATVIFAFNVLICTYGLFTCWYRENLIQAIGLIISAIASAAVLYQVYMFGYLDYNVFALSTGIGCFGLGMFIREYNRTKRIRKYVTQRQRRKTNQI